MRVCKWMVGFRWFRIPGTCLIPVSIAPLILVLPRLLMALNPSSWHRTSHLLWHRQCASFPRVFAPTLPPQKKSPHQTHDAQKFEHLQEPARRLMKKKRSNLNTVRASIAYIASKNVNKHYQETLASAFFKKNMSSSFTLSYLHSLFKYLWIEGLSQNPSAFGSFTFLLYVSIRQHAPICMEKDILEGACLHFHDCWRESVNQ